MQTRDLELDLHHVHDLQSENPGFLSSTYREKWTFSTHRINLSADPSQVGAADIVCSILCPTCTETLRITCNQCTVALFNPDDFRGQGARNKRTIFHHILRLRALRLLPLVWFGPVTILLVTIASMVRGGRLIEFSMSAKLVTVMTLSTLVGFGAVVVILTFLAFRLWRRMCRQPVLIMISQGLFRRGKSAFMVIPPHSRLINLPLTIHVENKPHSPLTHRTTLPGLPVYSCSPTTDSSIKHLMPGHYVAVGETLWSTLFGRPTLLR